MRLTPRLHLPSERCQEPGELRRPEMEGGGAAPISTNTVAKHTHASSTSTGPPSASPPPGMEGGAHDAPN